MKRVIFTVGPQGAGKTTFCRKLMSETDKVAYANRDEFVEKLYGKAVWDPYSGCLKEGERKFFQHVTALINRNDVVLVECFCSTQARYNDMFRYLTKGLEKDTPIRYEALLFTPSEEVCAEQYAKRCGRSGPLRETDVACAKYNYRAFWDTHKNLSVYFYSILEIDPNQQTLFSYAEILGLVHRSHP